MVYGGTSKCWYGRIETALKVFIRMELETVLAGYVSYSTLLDAIPLAVVSRGTVVRHRSATYAMVPSAKHFYGWQPLV